MGTIIGVKTYDLRFPTSSTLSGSDAMTRIPIILGIRRHHRRRG